MSFNALINLCKDLDVEYEIEGKTAPLTSIKVGGVAKLILFPSTIEAFCVLLAYINKNNIKFYVLGNGSNVYFSEYYDGVIVVTKNINNIVVDKNHLTAQCGADVIRCARMSLYHSLSGLEFAYGIPGTIGGALYMNAEAYGKRFGDLVKKSTVFDIQKNRLIYLNNANHNFSSKSSIFSQNKSYILIDTTLELKSSDYNLIKNSMLDNMNKRRKSQPLNLPSAGSAFKRSGDVIPSKLIDEIGLKGYRIGDAEISVKHAGFIVNSGDATAENINDLIYLIKSKIFNEYNVILEEEIIHIK